MTPMRFTATPECRGHAVVVVLPFDPDVVWGVRARHDISGTIGGRDYRGKVLSENGVSFLALGPAWRRDSGVAAGTEVEVVIAPEGPQIDNVPPDIAAALSADEEALTFFQSIPTFYRKNYIRWIEEARRPETRLARINETARLLRSGVRQR